jgi:hypothetical protein
LTISQSLFEASSLEFSRAQGREHRAETQKRHGSSMMCIGDERANDSEPATQGVRRSSEWSWICAPAAAGALAAAAAGAASAAPGPQRTPPPLHDRSAAACQMRRSIDNVVKTKIIPVIDPNVVGNFGGVLRSENFSRNFGPHRMAIPAAVEFLFCIFRKFREIRYFLSNRQSEGPLSRCFRFL